MLLVCLMFVHKMFCGCTIHNQITRGYYYFSDTLHVVIFVQIHYIFYTYTLHFMIQFHTENDLIEIHFITVIQFGISCCQ